MKIARDSIKELFEKLLIGPSEETETLNSKPSDMYLTGILWPRDASYGLEEDDDELERPSEDRDDVSVDRGAPVYHVFKPSSIGITCFIEGTSTPFNVQVQGARYHGKKDKDSTDKEKIIWERKPVNYLIAVQGNETRRVWKTSEFITSDGKKLVDNSIVVHIKRRVTGNGLSVTATLINASESNTHFRDENCFFQSSIQVTISDQCERGILARTNIGKVNNEDTVINNLLYRDKKEYAVGHGVSALWDVNTKGRVSSVRTSWFPYHVISSISPEGHPLLRSLKTEKPNIFSAVFLATNSQRQETIHSLNSFCEVYETWINNIQNNIVHLSDNLKETARNNTLRCHEALKRIKNGIDYLEKDDAVWHAFCLANEAMDNQSKGAYRGKDARPLIWRPFQLAFILMNLSSIIDPEDDYRECLDLLWFPTGGGKTEAYLCLIAFVIFYRRLTSEYSRTHVNVDVLTRYTLRLLTIQQFQRASAMICACDQIRKQRIKELGETPIAIGLYVGQGSTPNWVFDPKKENDAFSAIEEEMVGKHPACTPRQLLHCPLCGNRLGPDCYKIDKINKTAEIICSSKTCKSNGQPLPIYTVDEEIYRRLPSLIIATVDKFAQLPRNDNIGRLLGLPDGEPPALIIQDELHLISGPLGTMVGLYETALDLLCTRNGKLPKIIGSTATIGRASSQVKALYDCSVFQFPSPGIDATDSFFAVEDATKPDRLYAAICSSGRSPKFALQATIAALVQIIQHLLENKTYSEVDLDPYWTCVTYFNSLRELGGAEVMIHDDVRRSSEVYARRLNCQLRYLESRELVELTSRVPSNKIPEYLESLQTSLFSEIEKGVPVDIVLASNMISVGVDIPRLGLMVVNGQPKSTSEYIQATSRIGRGVPGLIITCLNAARPRDLSHFEHFKHYHQTIYSNVEATSVTPWSSRARDKALHAVLISAARHLVPGLTGDDGASNFNSSDSLIKDISQFIIQRAVNSGTDIDIADIDAEISEIIAFWHNKVKNKGLKNLEYWAKINPFNRPTNYFLMKNAEEASNISGGKPTPNSLREVEPSAYFSLWPASYNAD